MRSGFFYLLPADNKHKVNKFRLSGVLLLVFVLLFGSGTSAYATAPFFVNGSTQYLTVCAGDTVNIDYLLTVTDPDAAQTETWSVSSNPFNGAVMGLPTSQPSGIAVSPTGVLYVADTGAGITNDFIMIAVSDGGDPVNVTILVTVTQRPSITLGPNPAVCAGDTAVLLTYTGLANVGPDTFTVTEAGVTSWTVPPGVDSVHFDVQGARGGRQNATPPPYLPGLGGRVQGTLMVSPGQSLDLYVGGVGADGSAGGAAGGFNGGGASSFYVYGSGGGGGGASDIMNAGTPLVVAGGGGGDGWDSTGTRAGGSGGGLTGGNSAINGGGAASDYAAGGSQVAGGAGATYPGWPAGMDGSQYQGGDGSSQGISGGGGGGYYGGGGGVWTGGGGGSSYTDPTLVTSFTHTSGYDTSNGNITLTYVIPGTYTIVWSDAAHTAGFADIASTPLPASPFKLTVPAGAPAAVYTGTLTVSSTVCMSAVNAFSVTVNSIPSVNVVPNQILCNGDSTTDVIFTGGPGAPVYNWVNNNPAMGLDVIGTGHIAKFLPINPFPYSDTATITVTPTENGCIGVSQSFYIIDNPIPVLTSTPTPPAICDSTLFSYMPTSATVGTAYAWSRATTAGITNTGTTGGGNVSETLNNTTNAAIPVVYQYILNYAGCMDTQNVTVNVYPHPILTSTQTPAPICSGTTFDYTPQSNVESTGFAWSRESIPGISNATASGAGNPDETLTDTTASPVVVDYVYTLTYTGSTCSYTQDVMVTVNPTPMLNTPLIAGANCTNDTFSYFPGSNTVGTAFTWTRDTTTGLTNSPASDSGIVHELLVNPGPDPVIVTYTYSLTANGCPNTQNVTDTVKPTPMLSSTLTPDSICNNTLFTYVAASLTAGTTFAWIRDTAIGITNSPDSAATAIVNEILINGTTGIVPVIYKFTLTAEGCSNTQNVTVKVNPTPVLNNNPSVATICDNTFFDYTPASSTSGSTYTWTRVYVPGVTNLTTTSTGTTGVIHDSLNNTTYVNVDVTYSYVITANGCTNTEDVVLTVHPKPMLNTDTTATICSGSSFNYYPDSYTPTTTYTWSNTSVGGVSPTGVNGSGNINATLTSTLTSTAQVVYVYTLTAYGCTNTEDVTVTVNPSPILTDITIHPSGYACDNTMYQNFGASLPPAPGMHYNWVAENGYVWAIGANGQYCIVNFNTPGDAVVYLVINNDTTGCGIDNAFPVSVSSAGNINPEVIYYTGMFICKDADVDNYQWGYDDAISFDSTAIIGANNQNYAIANPDTLNKLYWVITNRGGCTQKSYYRVPGSTTGIVNVNDQMDMKVYPNPAAEFINVELEHAGTGNVNIAVTNMLGQKVNSTITIDNRAKIDVAGMPAGCYMIDCYRDGVKIATAKFIKN